MNPYSSQYKENKNVPEIKNEDDNAFIVVLSLLQTYVIAQQFLNSAPALSALTSWRFSDSYFHSGEDDSVIMSWF